MKHVLVLALIFVIVLSAQAQSGVQINFEQTASYKDACSQSVKIRVSGELSLQVSWVQIALNSNSPCLIEIIPVYAVFADGTTSEINLPYGSYSLIAMNYERTTVLGSAFLELSSVNIASNNIACGIQTNVAPGIWVNVNSGLAVPKIGIRAIALEPEISGLKNLGALDLGEYAFVLSGPYCNNTIVYWQIATVFNTNGYGMRFNYGFVPNFNNNGTVLIQPAEFGTDAYDNHIWYGINSYQTNYLANEQALVNAPYSAGYALVLPVWDDLSGMAVYSEPGSFTDTEGVILTRVSIRDGLFQVLENDETGRWLKIKLQNGIEGWVYSHLVKTN